MEMSALMTLAIYRSVKLSGLLVVSDELFDLKWHRGFSSPLFKKRCERQGTCSWNCSKMRHSRNRNKSPTPFFADPAEARYRSDGFDDSLRRLNLSPWQKVMMNNCQQFISELFNEQDLLVFDREIREFLEEPAAAVRGGAQDHGRRSGDDL